MNNKGKIEGSANVIDHMGIVKWRMETKSIF